MSRTGTLAHILCATICVVIVSTVFCMWATCAETKHDNEIEVKTVPLRIDGKPVNAAGGLTIDQEGNLYLSDFGPRFGVPTTSAKVYRYSTSTGEVTVFASGFRGASGCCFDSKGNFYQSNPSGSRISRVTPDGKTELAWVTEGMKSPIGIVADSKDQLFVCNCGSNSIWKITPEGKSEEFASSDLMNCPNGLTIDDEDNLYACNFQDGRVLKITPQGDVSEVVTLPELRGGPSKLGNGHMVYHDGKLYVATIGTGQIFEVSLNGDKRLIAGKANSFSNHDGNADEATFSKPNGIAVSSDGTKLYVLTSEPTWRDQPQELHPTLLRVITNFAPNSEND